MGNDRLKVGVIGTGRMGRLYARIITELPQTELRAVCGRSEAPVAELALQWNVAGYAGGDYRRMLEAHPDLDAVVVATPEWLHLGPALAVMGAGRHLLLEKPMAASVLDAERIATAAESAGVTLMLCHQSRFDPRFALLKEAVDRGEIGEVLHVYARRNTTAVAAARVEGRIPLTCWISPHDLDLLLWITGSRVTSVAARTHGGARAPDAYFVATLGFANGVTAVFEQSWGAPPLDGRPRQAQFDVRGTAGVIEVSVNEHGLGIFKPDSAVYPPLFESPIVHGKVFGVFPAMVAHFADCVLSGRRPLIDGRDGLATVVVADAIARALREGKEDR
ncbi:MAG: Gfo/Idh/MocA family oxidoreductase [Chloroflexi bacterium]|nr:Gfo/Idh/MocA family oxidoreductase [Chloroflexota bacterium]